MTTATPRFPLAGQAALYAEAAYEDPEGFKRMVGAEDDDLVFIDITDGKLDVQAYIHTCHQDQRVWVAVRGSETSKWDDWLANFSFRAVITGQRLGRVHRGFHYEAQAIGERVIDALRATSARYEVVLTGHSKGGSICTVLQHVYDIRATVHTFGEARSLGWRAAGLYNLSHPHHYRWVNTIDPVPKLLWWAYRHVGRLIYLDRQGQWNHGYVNFKDRVLTRLRNPFGGIPRHAMSRYRELVTTKPGGDEAYIDD